MYEAPSVCVGVSVSGAIIPVSRKAIPSSLLCAVAKVCLLCIGNITRAYIFWEVLLEMMRRGGLLCAAGLLSAAGITDAFYLPGKAPNSYTDGEKVCLAC